MCKKRKRHEQQQTGIADNHFLRFAVAFLVIYLLLMLLIPHDSDS